MKQKPKEPKRPHNWYLDQDGKIDIWRVDAGYHNGPECQDCFRAACHHCHRDIYYEECGG